MSGANGALAPQRCPHDGDLGSITFERVRLGRVRPVGKSVTVLSQRDRGDDWNFFDTRWQLWQGLARRLAPAARRAAGGGSLMLLDDGTVFGPLARLGYNHAWPIGWTT